MVNFKRFAIGFGALFLFGISFGFIGFPALLKMMLRKMVVLKPGSDIRELWTKAPFAIDFFIYVFNITNPDEVIAGGKPVVHEIGPYVFDEWKDKYDLEDNEEEDTVTFNMRNTFIFRPDKSNGLTGEEMITMPHPLIMPLSIAIKRDRAPMMPIISKAIEIIFKDAKALISAKFMDLFFRGIPVDCTSEDFEAKAICVAFATGEVKGGVPFNDTHFSFSLFGAANHSNAGRFTVYRGVKNSRDVGRVVLFDDETELSVWDGDECNQYVGTDSTIFPPLMKVEDGLWAFAADLCRSLGAYFERKSSYAGIPTLRYTIDFGDLKNEEHNHCFCNDPPDGCPPKGTFDLTKCVGGPLMVSLPHFFKGDEKLTQDVLGLNPNEKEHAIFLEFEIMSGTPLSAAKRLQFNLDVEPVEAVEPMKNLRKMLLPMFWVEEGASLNKTYTDQLKNSLFLGLKVNSAIKWISVIVGFIGLAGSLYMQYRKSDITSGTKPVTVSPTSDDDKNRY